MNHVNARIDVQEDFGQGLDRVFVELLDKDVKAEIEKRHHVQVVVLTVHRDDGTQARFYLGLQANRNGQLQAELKSLRKTDSDDETPDVSKTAAAYFRKY